MLQGSQTLNYGTTAVSTNALNNSFLRHILRPQYLAYNTLLARSTARLGGEYSEVQYSTIYIRQAFKSRLSLIHFWSSPADNGLISQSSSCYTIDRTGTYEWKATLIVEESPSHRHTTTAKDRDACPTDSFISLFTPCCLLDYSAAWACRDELLLYLSSLQSSIWTSPPAWGFIRPI